MKEITGKPNSKCVVLVPLHRIDTAHHIAQQQQLQVTITHDPATAMAELCLLHQQLRCSQGWIETSISPQMILIQTTDIPFVQQMIASVRTYLPNAILLQLHNGRLEQMNNHDAIVDSITDSPIIQSEQIDANELSMLLDDPSPETEE